MHVINRFVVINLNLGGFEGSYPTSIAYFPEFVVLLKIKMHVGNHFYYFIFQLVHQWCSGSYKYLLIYHKLHFIFMAEMKWSEFICNKLTSSNVLKLVCIFR